MLALTNVKRAFTFAQKQHLSLVASLCGGDGGNEQFADFTAFCEHILVFLFGYHMRTFEQTEPVIRFITLLKRNLKLINEIGFACGIIRFVYICTDTCSTAQYLI